MYSLRSRLFYNGTFVIAHPLMTLGFSLRTAGMRHMPTTGPVLILANHESYFDPLLVGLAVRRQISYLARRTLFRNPAFRWLIQNLGAVPIDQEGVGREGLQLSTDILQAGNPLLIFPEGERSPDGRMLPFKAGIMLVLRRCPVPVLPVGVAGAFESFPRDAKWPIPSPLFWSPTGGSLGVSVGRLITPTEYQSKHRESALTLFSDAVAAEVRRAETMLR